MPELLQENVILLIVALLIGIAVAWWVFVANRKTTVHRDEAPVEDQAAPARRNQALIDSAPAATKDEAPVPPVTPEAMGGAGVAVAAAAAEEERMATPAPSPAPEPAPAPAPAVGGSDDLSRIKGVGPKLVAKLHDLGVSSYSEIAGWTDEDIDRIDVQLGRFSGRIRRDNWVEQARLLQSGDEAAYAAKFGNV